MEDFDAAVQVIIEAWTLPDAPARLRMKVAQMQRRAFELQAAGRADARGAGPAGAGPGCPGDGSQVPTLVTCGADEMSDFKEAAERLAATIPGARSVVIEGAGHLAPMERPRGLSRRAAGIPGRGAGPASPPERSRRRLRRRPRRTGSDSRRGRAAGRPGFPRRPSLPARTRSRGRRRLGEQALEVLDQQRDARRSRATRGR